VLSQQAGERMQAGICPVCVGPFGSVLEPGPEAGQTLVLTGTCESCGISAEVGLGPTLVRHPEVSSFLTARGVTPQDCPPWDEQFHEGEGLTVRVPDEPPPRARVAFHSDGDSLWLSVDDDGTVRRVGTPP